MEAVQLYILIINVFVLLVMTAFLAKNRDLNGRLFLAEQIQDNLRQRIKHIENTVGEINAAMVNDYTKTQKIKPKAARDNLNCY